MADANTGRILTIVNQKLALGSGFQPCSTIKVSVALAALSEKMIAPSTSLRVYGRSSMNLTQALAHSNNTFFANLGVKLGFEKVSSLRAHVRIRREGGARHRGRNARPLPCSAPRRTAA